ncbi:glycerate kinase [Raineyella fluvialis]|uniref:Glycerate kinase n=1 Tax=Raineyella fluvialis TaxID=2662261 RepID=A0A5Q2FGD7_9ACTN|nr:glycerate kinase [Raineyella fluvialis]QGF23366.1 glycerate kinase [Raineyella fluvialis]
MSRSRVIVACDKFKGSLDARQVTEIITTTVKGATGRPVSAYLVADGGDGTLTALRLAGFDSHPVTVDGPTGEPVRTSFLLRDGVAVVEMADACGLLRLPTPDLAPLTASSKGLGQVLRAALELEPAEVIIGIGGSASTDGGTGLMVGLGAVLRDSQGNPVAPGAELLAEIDSIDLSGLPAALATTRVTLACDVDNPLLGPRGTVAVFGPQKGVDAELAPRVEAGLEHWADVVARTTGQDLRSSPGAGAAGGVGIAALAFLGAAMRPGIELVLEVAGFADALADAALVITGEGSLDEQTLSGKAVAGVAAEAGRAGVPVVAVCGRSLLTPAQAEGIGLGGVYPLTDLEPDPAISIRDAADLLRQRLTDVVEEWL